MTFDFRYPNITGATEKEQLQQLRTYIHQLVDELKWALNSVENPQGSYVVVQQPSRGGSAPLSTVDLNDDSTQVRFNELKPLIIKSAEIVNAYYEEINKRLESKYVAESTFGTFSEQTVQDISATATEIEQVFNNIQEIITDIENINFTLADVHAHIKAGLLDYEGGVPVYGLEIGQKNVIDGVEVFNKYARFTSDRLSFYDKNDIEVAYISDYKLYITHAEVTGTLKLGGYLVDTTKGLTFKWVGRS